MFGGVILAHPAHWIEKIPASWTLSRKCLLARFRANQIPTCQFSDLSDQSDQQWLLSSTNTHSHIIHITLSSTTHMPFHRACQILLYKEDVKYRWSFLLKPKATVLEERRKILQNRKTTLFKIPHNSKHIRLGASTFITSSLPPGISTFTFSPYHRLYYITHRSKCTSVVKIK